MPGQVMDKNRNPQMKHMLPIWALADLTGTEPLCVGHCFLIGGIFGSDVTMLSGKTPVSVDIHTCIPPPTPSHTHTYTNTYTHPHPFSSSTVSIMINQVIVTSYQSNKEVRTL